MTLLQTMNTALFPAKAALPNQGRTGHTRDRGAALIITLLLLALMSGLSLLMFMSVSSGLLINGYYRNFRGSFYAADSGANIVRKNMVNQILASAPVTYLPGNPPIPAGTPGTVQASVLGTYGAPTSLNSGGAASSWAESFSLKSSSLTIATNSPTTTANDPVTGLPSGYQYIYNYDNIIVGMSQGSEQATIEDKGEITINTLAQPAGNAVTSFAAWGSFIDQYAPCSGFLVPGLFSGPTFTNGTWNFGPPAYGQYIFTDAIGMAGTQASFWFNSGGGWTCDPSPNGSDTFNGQTIAPQYQSTQQWGQPSIPLPTNTFSQEQAVLDGIGVLPPLTGVSQALMAATLRDVNGTPYPSSGTPLSGVYLPTSTTAFPGCSTPHPCFTGGGIYVEGTADVQLAATTDSLNNNTETYTISQSGTTTIIVVNNTTNTTSISSGATSQVITGVPSQRTATGTPTSPATMLYVSGSVTSLTGPTTGTPPLAAIQDKTALTIATPGDVTITGDVMYKTEPVTTTQNQIAGTPPDTLIPLNNNGQVLGIFTSKGNINLAQLIDGGNIQVDGSLAAISQGGTGGFFNTGACINTFNNIGGQIQNNIYGAYITTENTYFDRRFANGFAPPWFPATTVTTPPGQTTATYTPSVTRIQWINTSHI